ncbi:MAG: VOC family protein, partial [Flavobacteriales bacterium]
MNLNQITVPSLDVESSIFFYQKLGLELIVHSDSHYARFICPDGKATFSILQVDELPQGVGIKVYFEINELDKKVNELIDKGIEFDQLPEDQPWLWREAYLKDPYGNQLILYFAG